MSFPEQPHMTRQRAKNPNTIKPMDFILNLIWNFLRPKLVNFKTSINGVGIILVALSTSWKELEALVNGGTPDVLILSLAAQGFMTGWGFLIARDADKSTLESIGAQGLLKHGLVAERELKKGGK
jgi:hypothetical protein